MLFARQTTNFEIRAILTRHAAPSSVQLIHSADAERRIIAESS